MSKIVSSAKQAVDNLLRFQSELRSSADLQGRLAYARAWYAHRDDKGEWHFGPSKFIGYQSMTAKEYVNDDPRDGRQTERKLGLWFTEVPESDPLHEMLSDKLAALLEKYGKAPSAKMRINVATDVYEEHIGESDQAIDRTIADLMIVLAKKLPSAERKRVRAVL